MKTTTIVFLMLLVLLVLFVPSPYSTVHQVHAYPPGVGILSKAKDCVACHANNGPWKDDENTIIDIVEKDSQKSYKQPDGTFLIEVKRGELQTVRTLIGRKKGDKEIPSYRNAWMYVDPTTIESSSLSKFAPGWEVNLPLACRVVGDNLEGYDGASITLLPMTIRPLDAARNADLTLQVMLTRGESVKGKAKEGMIGSYFERRVKLKVIE